MILERKYDIIKTSKEIEEKKMSYKITDEQRKEIEQARKENKNKNVEKRLKALVLRAEGKSLREIGEQCGYHPSYVSNVLAAYSKRGLEAIIGNHYKANRHNMTYEEEEALLEQFRQRAEAGEIVETSEIKAAYEAALGRTIESRSQIYYVLRRHGWRKVMPRRRHLKKASEEEINSSKKLNH